jgi:uracil-DNA glycosylase family 4
MRITDRGNPNAKIVIIGDVGGGSDYSGGPFSGSSGSEFTKMLHEAGIIQSECYLTLAWPHVFNRFRIPTLFAAWNKQKNVAKTLLSPELHQERIRLLNLLDKINPNVVIVLEELPLFLLTNNLSPSKWRGSTLESVPHANGRTWKVIPTYHPDQVMAMWSRRYQVVNDFKRAKKESEFPGIKKPDYLFHLEPTREEIFEFLTGIRADLDFGPMKLSSDIETIGRHISCSGLAISNREAMCIPLISRDKMDGYLSEEDEIKVVRLHKEILTHPNAQVIGQNWLYDVQFFARFWGFIARPYIDTMIGWHALFPGEPKSLDFLSSMLCDHHEYWKDDVKDYTKYPDDEHKYWKYNAKDCVITYEVAEKEIQLIPHFNLHEQFNFLMDLFIPVLKMMLRGTRIDTQYKNAMTMQLWEAMTGHEQWFESIIDWRVTKKNASPWYRSPKQLADVLYNDLNAPVQRHKKTKSVTTDDKALEAIAQKEPALRPLITKLQEYRSLGIFKSNFADAKLDPDKRIRCSYGIAGPETFRFNSKISVFGTGANLQTIPKGNKLEED